MGLSDAEGMAGRELGESKSTAEASFDYFSNDTSGHGRVITLGRHGRVGEAGEGYAPEASNDDEDDATGDAGGSACGVEASQVAEVRGSHSSAESTWPTMSTAFVHAIIDVHSCIACAEIEDDEKSVTASGVLERVVAWFADSDVTVERVLRDSGSTYRAQTKGKIERFHLTLNEGRVYAEFYNSEIPR